MPSLPTLFTERLYLAIFSSLTIGKAVVLLTKFYQKESHKNRLNKQGHDYIQNNEYDEAIIFYESLLTNPLFKNDIKPYRVLSELYQERNEPYNDVKTLTK